MLFTKQKSTGKFVLNINGKSIDKTSKAKYVGIIVDDKAKVGISYTFCLQNSSAILWPLL